MSDQSPIKIWNGDLKHHLLVSALYNICLEIVKSAPLSVFLVELRVEKVSLLKSTYYVIPLLD
jgi:hypothetical protein